MHENCSACKLGTTSQKENTSITSVIGSVQLQILTGTAHLENASPFPVSADYPWNSSSMKENDLWMCQVPRVELRLGELRFFQGLFALKTHVFSSLLVHLRFK